MADKTLLDGILEGLVEAIATRTAELVTANLLKPTDKKAAPAASESTSTGHTVEEDTKPEPAVIDEPVEQAQQEPDPAKEIDPADALRDAQNAMGKLIGAKGREGAIEMLAEFGVKKLSGIKDVAKLVEFKDKAYAVVG